MPTGGIAPGHAKYSGGAHPAKQPPHPFMVRPGSAQSTVGGRQPGAWTCASCGYFNFAERMTSNSCQAPYAVAAMADPADRRNSKVDAADNEALHQYSKVWSPITEAQYWLCRQNTAIIIGFSMVWSLAVAAGRQARNALGQELAEAREARNFENIEACT